MGLYDFASTVAVGTLYLQVRPPQRRRYSLRFLLLHWVLSVTSDQASFPSPKAFEERARTDNYEMMINAMSFGSPQVRTFRLYFWHLLNYLSLTGPGKAVKGLGVHLHAYVYGTTTIAQQETPCRGALRPFR